MSSDYKNQERVYRLCDCVIDLINEISMNTNYGDYVDWIKDEIQYIKDDINNSN